jgi:two-component sensor histidine kinase
MQPSLTYLRLSKPKVTVFVWALALLTFTIDLQTPEDIDVSLFYAMSIAACAWVRSPRFLWLTATTIALFVFADLHFGVGPLHPYEPRWIVVLDRVFDASALLLLASVVHFWMHSLQSLDDHQLLLEKHIDLSRELQHRVRNDLQVLLRFLDEQARRTGDHDAKGGFEFVARRVMSLGRIYNHLVGTDVSGTMDFDDYLRSLCSGVGEFQTIQRAGVNLLTSR